MRPDVYVNPRERICSLFLSLVCLSLSLSYHVSGSVWFSWSLLASLTGRFWGWTGDRQRVCSEPSWQSASLTQRRELRRKICWLEFLNHRRTSQGHLSNLVLWYLLEPSLPACHLCLILRACADGTRVLLQAIISLSRIPRLWSVYIYQRWNPRPVFTLGNFLAHCHGEKQICD